MIKEFIPYQESKDLKELGFDEPCFAYFDREDNQVLKFDVCYENKNLSAPTFSQAFRWFREKNNLCGEVYTVNMGAIDYTFQIRDLYSEDVKHDNFEAYTGGYVGTFLTYEEAELACLIKLIEIVKNK